jgi:uncharacterized protein (DUF1330 family)
MPAYLIAEHKITDPVKFEEYRVKVGPMMAKHGGRYLTKGGDLPLNFHPAAIRATAVDTPSGAV